MAIEMASGTNCGLRTSPRMRSAATCSCPKTSASALGNLAGDGRARTIQRPFIRLFRRLRLFLGQHSLRGLQRPLRPRVPASRIDKGMRIAGFAGRQQLSPLKNAAAGIAIGWLPRMGHEVHLHTLNGVELLGVDHASLRTLEARLPRPPP